MTLNHLITLKSLKILLKTGTETRANVLFAKNYSFVYCIVEEKEFFSHFNCHFARFGTICTIKRKKYPWRSDTFNKVIG